MVSGTMLSGTMLSGKFYLFLKLSVVLMSVFVLNVMAPLICEGWVRVFDMDSRIKCLKNETGNSGRK